MRAALMFAACGALLGACLAIGHASAAGAVLSASHGQSWRMLLRRVQNTVPQAPEQPVSPTTPGTLPGTQAGAGTSLGTNPITGQPCSGGGSSAINGGIPGASTVPGGPAQPGAQVGGLPPSRSVYGLNRQPGNSGNLGAC